MAKWQQSFVSGKEGTSGSLRCRKRLPVIETVSHGCWGRRCYSSHDHSERQGQCFSHRGLTTFTEPGKTSHSGLLFKQMLFSQTLSAQSNTSRENICLQSKNRFLFIWELVVNFKRFFSGCINIVHPKQRRKLYMRSHVYIRLKI